MTSSLRSLITLAWIATAAWPVAVHAQIVAGSPAFELRADTVPARHALSLGAGDLQPIADRQRPSRSSWYGWQTLAADAVSLLLVPVAGFGVGSFFLATPIIHGLHGRVAVAVGSLGLRSVSTILPAALWLNECFTINLSGLGGAGSGSSSHRDPVSFCNTVLPAWFVVGLVSSVALDGAVFSHESVRPQATARALVMPWYTAGSGGLLVAGHL